MGLAPVGVQCPLTSPLGEFQSRLLGWLWYPAMGYRLCWCPSPFPSPSIYRYISIHSSLPAIGFFIRVLSLRRRICTHSVDPSLTHCLCEFPGLGLALIPDVVVPEAESGFLSGLFPIARPDSLTK